MSEPEAYYPQSTDPETLTEALLDLSSVYPDPVIIRCPRCNAAWGIRLKQRQEHEPLSALSCIRRDCGRLFLC